MISIKPDEPEKPIKTADDPWLDELSAIDPPVAPAASVEPVGTTPNQPDAPLNVSLERTDSESPQKISNVTPAEAAVSGQSRTPSEDYYPILDPAATDIPPSARSAFDAASPLRLNDRADFDTTPPPLEFEPAPQYETMRRSGLAWSAGIVFFGTVAFTLLLGWIADLLIGSAPWGLVGGIVFGSILAFVQFFRISSRIFPSSKKGPEVNPLMSSRDDEDEGFRL